MNPELFSLRPSESIEDAIGYLVALGISGAPVIEAGRPVGVATLSDLLAPKLGTTVRERMTSPAITIERSASVHECAERLSELGLDRLVVVDEDGRAVGVVSLIDVLRALLGRPVAHPAAFPHVDRLTGLAWSDDEVFDLDHATHAPAEPGLLVLVRGGADRTERIVWAEECNDLRSRLVALASYLPDEEPPYLRNILSKPHEIRFRTAVARNAKARGRALRKVIDAAARF